MSLADDLLTHHRDRKRTSTVINLGNREIRVFAKAQTPVDFDKVARKFPDFPEKVSMGAMVYFLILKCEDEGGTKMFTPADQAALNRLPMDVINQLYVALMPAADIDLSEEAIEEEEKN